MGMTMTQKILAKAAGLDRVEPGQLIEARLNMVLGNDITTPVAITEFEKAGFTQVFDRDKIAIVLDHYTPCKDIKSAQEIMDEGRILKHCVAGYADRHMQGQVTILFMREAAAPDKPFLTIEMAGNKLVQIHGYRNEGLYSAKGRFAPDPREVHREWLDTWLEWLKKGSKRDKKGKPVLPKKRGNVA